MSSSPITRTVWKQPCSCGRSRPFGPYDVLLQVIPHNDDEALDDALLLPMHNWDQPPD